FLTRHACRAVKLRKPELASSTLEIADEETRENAAAALVISLLDCGDLEGARQALGLVKTRAHLVAEVVRRLLEQGADEVAISIIETERQRGIDPSFSFVACTIFAVSREGPRLLSYLQEAPSGNPSSFIGLFERIRAKT